MESPRSRVLNRGMGLALSGDPTAHEIYSKSAEILAKNSSYRAAVRRASHYVRVRDARESA